MVDNIKLPKTRPSAAARQDFEGLTSDADKFLPKALSKQAQKRQVEALEETHIRVVVMKATALLEKLAADYRFAAKRYELARFIDEADHYQMLIDRAQTKGGKNVARQAVEQWTVDLYSFIWDLSKTADEHTRRLIEESLYPEKQEEQDLLKSLGVWLFRGRA
jgi:riboflavin biosynthesis pyrimidine reductase